MMTLSASSSERRKRKSRAATNWRLRSTLPWSPKLNFMLENRSMTSATRRSTRRAGVSLFIKAQKNCRTTGKARFQRGNLLDFFPIDVLAIEAVTGTRISGKLIPQVIESAAFTDALPEILDPHERRLPWSSSTGRGWGGDTHGVKYRTLGGGARNGTWSKAED